MKKTVAVLGVAFVALSGTDAYATKIHRLYQSTGSFYGGSQYGKIIHRGPTGSNAIYVFMEEGDGMLLMRTDLSGNVVWSNRYGVSQDNPVALEIAADGNLLMAFYAGDTRVAKINAVTGAVMWANEYLGMEHPNTITRRGTRYVVMGEGTYINGTGDFLRKPVAMSISGADGSVSWSKIYYEGSNEKESFDHELEGYAVNPGEVIYAGRWYEGTGQMHVPGNRRITMLRINANTGLVPINAFHTYIVELNAADYAVETDAPFPVDIARIQDPATGVYDGFAISGSYSHSDTYTPTATDPFVLRVEQDGVPRWSTLYGSPYSAYGFARGVRQNAYFNGGRLDVFSTWGNYNAPDASGTVDGFLRINQNDGTAFGIAVYDPPDDHYAGNTMNVDGDGGYLGLGHLETAPYDSFQLLKVGQIGGGVDCMADHDLEPEELEVASAAIEVVPEDKLIIVQNHDLEFEALTLTVTECDPSMAMSLEPMTMMGCG